MKTGQSKFSSLLEANVNTFVGFLVTLVFTPPIYHLVGMTYTYKQMWVVTILFTILSVVRGYLTRRFFNKKEKEKEEKEIKMYQDINAALNLDIKFLRDDLRNRNVAYDKIHLAYLEQKEKLEKCQQQQK